MAQWKGIVGRRFTPEEFDAYVSSLTFDAWRPQFVVLHNTAVPKLSEWHQVSGEQRMHGLESYYRDTKHWSAGPHLFVADDLIWVFTPLTTSGIHSPSWNHVSWGVEMVGDYTAEPFDPRVRDNAVEALAILHGAIGLDSHTMRLHKEDPKTTHRGCPGIHVDKEEMIQRVHDRIVARNPGDHTEDRPGG
jgi:N-acetylmuramoyl-L-alanine amidase-like protein